MNTSSRSLGYQWGKARYDELDLVRNHCDKKWSALDAVSVYS